MYGGATFGLVSGKTRVARSFFMFKCGFGGESHVVFRGVGTE